MIAEKIVNIQYYRDFKRKYVYELVDGKLDGLVQYGIRVEKEDSKSHICDEVKNISSSKDKVLEIMNLLAKNCVSPLHLKNIVEEYVDTNCVDF